ncbi:MAG: gliding motility-associated C-terminal domain-containing protein, partial [Cyclobacteriaceae bacterium]|nr:gliding motility-associated C-terminal domain-containing protein [Cyclobacteriaceae bacterium]
TFVLLYGGNKLSASALKAHVIIYNRWGGKVYESADYQDDWDGKNVEAGVYYYSVEVEGEATCKGWVHVVK